MARIRSIKPGYFTNEALAEASIPARFLGVSLLCLADREGRLKDAPKVIKLASLPWDDVDVDGLLTELANVGFILRYRVGGERLIQITNFAKHQVVNSRESASCLPPPESTVHAHDLHTMEGKGREKEREEEGEHAPPADAGGVPASASETTGSVSDTLKAVSPVVPDAGPGPAGRRTQPAPKPGSPYTTDFETFWSAYPGPRKTDKLEAFGKFKRALSGGATLLDLLAGLERWKLSEDWRKDGGAYICAPVRWLNRRGWEDAPAPAQGATFGGGMTGPPTDFAGAPWHEVWVGKAQASTTPSGAAHLAQLLGADQERAMQVCSSAGFKAAADWAWENRRTG